MIALARSLTIAAGICAILWSVSVFPVFRLESPLSDAEQRILSVETFNDAQLDAIKGQLPQSPDEHFSVSGSISSAVIRLRLLERELQSAQATDAPGLPAAERAVQDALAKSPTNSYMWLAEYWLKHRRDEPVSDGLQLLDLSYRTGPNEGWIAQRRSPVALSAFASLPKELAQRSLSEFAGLVRSGLDADAANILAGPGWPVREQLLRGLAQLDESDRRRFAHALEAKDLEEDVVVPGLEDRRRHPD